MKLTARHYALLPLLALTLPSCAAPQEMMVIGLVVLLLFGGAKLPQLMRGMGSGINEFKKGLKEGDPDLDQDSDGDDKEKDSEKE